MMFRLLQHFNNNLEPVHNYCWTVNQLLPTH